MAFADSLWQRTIETILYMWQGGDTMSLTKEDLLAISNLAAKHIKPLKKELHTIRVNLLENNVIPR